MGAAVGQRGCHCRLREIVTSARIHRSAAPLGGGAHVCLAFAQPAHEQGLREAVRDERGVRLRGDDSADGEAVGPCLGLFGQSHMRRSRKFALRKRAVAVFVGQA